MAPSEPLILAFDTSGPWVAVALTEGTRLRAQRREETARGQAERLMPMIEATLADDGLPLAALDAVAVGIGPGNFTGIRISVAAARGLALALGVPAIGVSGFEALRGPDSRRTAGRAVAILPAPRDGLYLQGFEDGRARGPAHHLADLNDPDWMTLGIDRDTFLLGEKADLLSERYPRPGTADGPPWKRSALPTTGLAATIAAIAADIVAEGGTIPRPAPLYVRPADAAPSREAGPTMLPC